MTKFDIAYIIGGVLLLAFELWAVLGRKSQGSGNTISHKVIAWIARKPKSRRVLVGAGLLWLAWHWIGQPF